MSTEKSYYELKSHNGLINLNKDEVGFTEHQVNYIGKKVLELAKKYHETHNPAKDKDDEYFGALFGGILISYYPKLIGKRLKIDNCYFSQHKDEYFTCIKEAESGEKPIDWFIMNNERFYYSKAWHIDQYTGLLEFLDDVLISKTIDKKVQKEINLYKSVKSFNDFKNTRK